MLEHTVVLLKPDAIFRGLVGEIISRFEKVGIKIVAMKMIWVDEDLVSKHYPMSRTDWVKKIGEKTLTAYEEYGKDVGETLGTDDPEEIGKLVCQWLVSYLTSGPVVAMVLEGNRAVSAVRKIVGYTYPDAAAPGTIRGDLSHDSADLANEKKRAGRNLVHASGSVEEAQFEEKLWFHESEIHAYKRTDEEILFS